MNNESNISPSKDFQEYLKDKFISENATTFKAIDDFLDKEIRPKGEIFKFKNIPDISKFICGSENEIVFSTKVLNKAKKIHNLSNDEIKLALQSFASPVLIFESNKNTTENKLNSLLYIENFFASSQKPLAVTLNIDANIEEYRKQIKVNEIRSIHDRTLIAKNGTNLIQKWTNDGLCRYVDDKKISAWQLAAGVQFPLAVLQTDKNNIKTFSDFVNQHSIPWEVQEYKQKYLESLLDISEDTKNELENVFSQIDDYLDKGIAPEEGRFTLPETPLYLKELGSNETAISLPVSVIKKAKEAHGLSNAEIKNSLSRLYDPVAVFDTDKTKSENRLDSKLILTDEFSESKPIALAININSNIRVNNGKQSLEVQDIRSIHDRTLTAKNGTDLVNQWTKNGLCRYVDDKKISEWSNVARVYFPIDELQSDKNNILTKSDFVNHQQIQFNISQINQNIINQKENEKMENAINFELNNENQVLEQLNNYLLYGKQPKGNKFVIKKTPNVLQYVGIKPLEIEFSTSVINKAKKIHKMTNIEILNTVKKIADPLLVFDSDKSSTENKKDSIILITDENVLGENKPSAVSMNLSIDGVNNNYKINSITSIHGRGLIAKNCVNIIEEWKNKGLLKYVDDKKISSLAKAVSQNEPDIQEQFLLPLATLDINNLPCKSDFVNHQQIQFNISQINQNVINQKENEKMENLEFVKSPSQIATELVLEKLKQAKINVITEESTMQAILNAGIEVQKMSAHYGTNQNIENSESFNGYGVYVLSVNEENAKTLGLKIASKKYGNSFYINNQPLGEFLQERNFSPYWQSVIRQIQNPSNENLLNQILTSDVKGNQTLLKQQSQLSTLCSLNLINYKREQTYLYSVEIPDNDGTNYLFYDKTIGQISANRINEELEKLGSEWKVSRNDTGNSVYFNILSDKVFNSQKQASEFLQKIGYVGMETSSSNYIIFDDREMNINNRVQYMMSENGEVYGFAYNGDIYADKNLMNSNVLAHEYTHLWDNYTKNANPNLWEIGKNVFKQTNLWNEVLNDPSYQNIKNNEDEILSECHARICGKFAQEVLERIAAENGENAKNAVIDWDAEVNSFIAKEFGLSPELGNENYISDSIKAESLKEFLASSMKDLMSGRGFENQMEKEKININQERSKFDEELYLFNNGQLDENHIFNLGKPGEILKRCGFPENDRIELSASRLKIKASQGNHPFEIMDILGLDKALQNPIAVFEYGDKEKSQNVIVNLEKDGKNFLVGVFFNQKKDGFEVSSIRGLFNRDNLDWMRWIQQGKMIYGDKERIQVLANQQRTNLADVNSKEARTSSDLYYLDSLDNILQNFADVKNIYTRDFPKYAEQKEKFEIFKQFRSAYQETDSINVYEAVKDADEFYEAIKNNDKSIIEKFTNGIEKAELTKVASLILQNGGSHVQLKGINTQALNSNYNKDNLLSTKEIESLNNESQSSTPQFMKSSNRENKQTQEKNMEEKTVKTSELLQWYETVDWEDPMKSAEAWQNGTQEQIDYIRQRRKEKIIDNGKLDDISELQETLKAALKQTAVPLEKIDFTKENFNKLFPRSRIETPIENVKMGANQFEKLEAKERQNLLLAVHDTLKNPDLIINEQKENVFGENENNHIYAKSFLINDKVHGIQSVVVSIDGENVSISTHERNINNIVNKIKKPDQLLFAAAKVRLLVEQHTEIPQSVVNPIRENEYVASPQQNIQQNSDFVKQEENPSVKKSEGDSREKLNVATYKFQSNETLNEIIQTDSSFSTEAALLDNLIDCSIREVYEYATEKEQRVLRRFASSRNEYDTDMKNLAIQTDCAARWIAAKHWNPEKQEFQKEYVNRSAIESFPYELPWEMEEIEEEAFANQEKELPALKTHSDLKEEKIQNLQTVTQEEFNNIVDSLYQPGKPDYKNIPEIIRLPKINSELAEKLGIENENFFMKTNIAHVRPQRKGGYDQSLRKEEMKGMLDFISSCKTAYIDSNERHQNFFLAGLDEQDNTKANKIVFNKDKLGNYIVTIGKFDIVNLQEKEYTKVAVGVEPTIWSVHEERSPATMLRPSTTLATENIQHSSDSVKQEENPFKNTDPEQIKELYEQAEAIEKMQLETAKNAVLDENRNEIMFDNPKNETEKRNNNFNKAKQDLLDFIESKKYLRESEINQKQDQLKSQAEIIDRGVESVQLNGGMSEEAMEAEIAAQNKNSYESEEEYSDEIDTFFYDTNGNPHAPQKIIAVLENFQKIESSKWNLKAEEKTAIFHLIQVTEIEKNDFDNSLAKLKEYMKSEEFEKEESNYSKILTPILLTSLGQEFDEKNHTFSSEKFSYKFSTDDLKDLNSELKVGSKKEVPIGVKKGEIKSVSGNDFSGQNFKLAKDFQDELIEKGIVNAEEKVVLINENEAAAFGTKIKENSPYVVLTIPVKNEGKTEFVSTMYYHISSVENPQKIDKSLKKEEKTILFGKTKVPEFAMMTQHGLESFKDMIIESYEESTKTYLLKSEDNNQNIRISENTLNVLTSEKYSKKAENYSQDTKTAEKMIETQYNDFFKLRSNCANNFRHNLSIFCRKEANSPLDALKLANSLISQMPKDEKRKTKELLNLLKKDGQSVNEVIIETYHEAVKEVPLNEDYLNNKRYEKMIARPMYDTISTKGEKIDRDFNLKIGDSVQMSFKVNKNSLSKFSLGKENLNQTCTIISASKEGNMVTVMDGNKSFYEVPRDTFLKEYAKKQKVENKMEKKVHRQMSMQIDMER